MRLFIILLVLSIGYQVPAYAKRSRCGTPAIVTLDIGHSPQRIGVTSARGRPEYMFNKRFVRELALELRSEYKVRVKILNPRGKNLTLAARSREIRRLRKGILLSIHHDSAQPRYLKKWKHAGKTRRYSDRFSGYSLFISRRTVPYSASRKLGMDIGETLHRSGFRRSLHHAERIRGESRPIVNRKLGLFRYDALAVLRRTRIPAVLVEVGVIINRGEERRLNVRGYRQNIIGAIALGIKKFCGLPGSRGRRARSRKNLRPAYGNEDMVDRFQKNAPPACNKKEYRELKRLGELDAWDVFLARCKTGRLARLARFQRNKLLRARRQDGIAENPVSEAVTPPLATTRQQRTNRLGKKRNLQKELSKIKKQLREINNQRDRLNDRQIPLEEEPIDNPATDMAPR